MTSPRRADGLPLTLIGALALTVLSLGMAWIGSISGYVLGIRVFLVAAIVLLAVAIAKRTTAPTASVNALGGAAVSLATAVALTVRAIEPAALAVVSLAVTLILVGRRQLRSA